MSQDAGEPQRGEGWVKNAVDVLNTPASASTDERVKAVRVRTTIVFAVVLVGLYGVAQAHTPRALVLCAFVVYVVAAVLWLRAQYVDALDGEPTILWRWLVWTTTLAGVLAVVAGLVLTGDDAPPVRPGALIIPGVLAIYLGIGHLIARSRALVGTQGGAVEAGGPGWWSWSWVVWMRRRAAGLRGSWQALLVVTAVFLVALFSGLLLVGSAPTLLVLLLLLPSLVVPWLMNLLAEHAINWLAEDEHDPRRTVLMVTAGVLAAVGVLLVGYRWGFLAASAAVVMVAFAVALASFTMADIAAVLAIIAFMGVTPQQDREDRPLPHPEPGDLVLVALGDSYMSGEGAATFVAGTDEGGGNECRRARTSWSMVAGGQPPFDEVVSFACSGADSPHIRHVPTSGETALAPAPFAQFEGEQTQLDQYDAWAAGLEGEDGAAFAPALVVLSIGGNDAGFSSIGLTCVVPGSCDADETNALWADGNLARVENRLRQVYAEVADTFPDTPVAVIPYPDPIHPSARTQKCASAMLQTGDVRFIKRFLGSLNARILRTSADFGFHYVDTMVDAVALRGLQICDPANRGRTGVNFIGLRSVGGLSEQRFNPTKWAHNSLHPNERGHAALQAAFQRWLDAEGGLEALTPPKAAGERGPGPGPVAETSSRDGDCATFPVNDPQGCRARSNSWAFGQAGQFAAWAGGIGLMIGALAWLAAVAFFGWRRSRATGRAA